VVAIATRRSRRGCSVSIQVDSVKLSVRTRKSRGYLLTPMDRATLPRTKSTISRRTPSVVTEQQALRAIFKARCYTDRQLFRLLTHTYTVRPKIYLVDLLSTYYTSTFATNTCTQQIELMELEPYSKLICLASLASSAVARCEQQTSIVDGIVDLS